MDLPLVGFVSIQGFVLVLLLLVLITYGYYAGLNKMLSPLFIGLASVFLAVFPRLHGWVSEHISLVFGASSRYAAYLLIFALVFIGLRFLFNCLPRVVELDLPRNFDKAFGAVAGLVLGFVACTLFLVLIYGWSLPWAGLYAQSDLGAIVCKIWRQISLLPELHSLLYNNPISVI